MCVESVRAEKKLFIAFAFGAQYQSKRDLMNLNDDEYILHGAFIVVPRANTSDCSVR